MVDVQHAACGVCEPFRICQPFRPGLADAENMGRHGQQLPDLLALHRKGKADIFRGQQPEARQRLGHVFFLVGQLIVDDALQPQQVILCGYNLEKQAVIPQNPVKFLGELPVSTGIWAAVAQSHWAFLYRPAAQRTASLEISKPVRGRLRAWDRRLQ